MDKKIKQLLEIINSLENDIITIINSQGGFINTNTDNGEDYMYTCVYKDSILSEYKIIALRTTQGYLEIAIENSCFYKRNLKEEDIDINDWFTMDYTIPSTTILSIAECIHQYCK